VRPANEGNEKMKRPILDSRRRAVLAVVAAFPEGRECAAACVGLDLKQFDNKLYENPGHRPLTDEQVRQLEKVAGTTYLTTLHMGLTPPPCLPRSHAITECAIHGDTSNGSSNLIPLLEHALWL